MFPRASRLLRSSSHLQRFPLRTGRRCRAVPGLLQWRKRITGSNTPLRSRFLRLTATKQQGWDMEMIVEWMYELALRREQRRVLALEVLGTRSNADPSIRQRVIDVLDLSSKWPRDLQPNTRCIAVRRRRSAGRCSRASSRTIEGACSDPPPAARLDPSRLDGLLQARRPRICRRPDCRRSSPRRSGAPLRTVSSRR